MWGSHNNVLCISEGCVYVMLPPVLLLLLLLPLVLPPLLPLLLLLLQCLVLR
jgi:hypothetical protein